jgi:hypothetical protein
MSLLDCLLYNFPYGLPDQSPNSWIPPVRLSIYPHINAHSPRDNTVGGSNNDRGYLDKDDPVAMNFARWSRDEH